MSLDLEALYRVLFDATERKSDTEIIDRPDWIQLRTPSSPMVQHDKVLRAVLAEKDAGSAAVRLHRGSGGTGHLPRHPCSR